MDYDVIIEQGRSKENDAIIKYLVPKCVGKVLDIGANAGYLISKLPDAIGVDNSPIVVNKAKELGRNVILIKDKLPFEDKTFDTVVLSCVLEQCDDWEKVLLEALRVCKDRCIGINPIPGSQWGKIRGWVKSVIDPDYMESFYGAVIQYPDIEGKYYFEIFA
jgi:Methylase involved in ubiquinone/menaquinone biosynthesis